jgi:hypothetical protein
VPLGTMLRQDKCSLPLVVPQLRASVTAFENLLKTAKLYRNALLALSTGERPSTPAREASRDQELMRRRDSDGWILSCVGRVCEGQGRGGEWGSAARGEWTTVYGQQLVPGPRAFPLFLPSVETQLTVLYVQSDKAYRDFEIPLLHAFDHYVSTISARHTEYESLLATRTAAIRATEADNFKQGRKKSRDLNSFRKALEKLQEQVKEVEACKNAYYTEVWENEMETWDMISGKVSADSCVVTLELITRDRYRCCCDRRSTWRTGSHPRQRRILRSRRCWRSTRIRSTRIDQRTRRLATSLRSSLRWG